MIEVRLLGPLQVHVDGESLPLGPPKQHAVLAMLATRPGRLVTLEELVDELWPDTAPASAVANRDLPTAGLRQETLPVLAGPAKPGLSPAPRRGAEQVLPTRWLPRPVLALIGRTETVQRMVEAVRRADPAAPVIQVIDGMAGIGKTALAVHVAAALSDRYPDAQLFIDLHGHSAARPVDPADAVVTLLRQLGVPASRIPPEFDHRVALWRAELGGRRTVVVLDNAGSRDQIEPLLPSAPGALVLVTSRRRLLASDGIPPESLGVLREDDAIELLATVAGPGRIRAELKAATTVVRRCGHLPLAIRLAGARLAHRPGWRVADLAQRLEHSGHVLGELSAEDRTVAAVFALSYEPLAERTQRVFRLLGLHPGEHFGLGLVAALADMSLEQSELVLDELVDRHLVEELRAGRFRLHDLLRGYAEQLVTSALESAERRSVTRRILDYYLHLALVATRAIEPVELTDQLGLDRPLRPDLVISDGSVGPEWLEEERDTLRRLVRVAAEDGHLNEVWRLARVIWRFYFIQGYNDEILETHRHALEAAIRLGNSAAIATIHNYRAYAWLQSGQPQRALRDLERAIQVRKSVDDRRGVCVSRTSLAIVYCQLGRLNESVAIHRQSFNERRRWAIDVLSALPSYGLPLMLLGRYAEALEVHRLHLCASRIARDQFNVAVALTNIGAVRLRLGQHDVAIRYLRAALRLKDRAGDSFGLPFALDNLGTAHRKLGQLQEARRHHELAFAAAARRGELLAQAAALNGIGLTLAELGRQAEALQYHRDALALATRASYAYEQGRALAAIADHLGSCDPAEARRHCERALMIFRSMGVPERFEVECQLAQLVED
ncbi:tetratricopeptide repeat protein [Micromonospora sp. WMMD1102]|uniref:ATP-binding protein n=1 Tax=Micromonospora sp. WMMD1102 TaxID=3016105 RepID=UPI0024154302|nr:tetratricopeptide repeat protein [Micromonospora sp. WMMD1102]MDG4790884.1 tetratricopeptide repeat protein [Micromonospora sp. WMMD1102]